MSRPAGPDPVRHTITHTPQGWLLVIENDHCSLSQLFRSSRLAHQALARTTAALELLTTQHLDQRSRTAGATGRRPVQV